MKLRTEPETDKCPRCQGEGMATNFAHPCPATFIADDARACDACHGKGHTISNAVADKKDARVKCQPCDGEGLIHPHGVTAKQCRCCFNCIALCDRGEPPSVEIAK